MSNEGYYSNLTISQSSFSSYSLNYPLFFSFAIYYYYYYYDFFFFFLLLLRDSSLVSKKCAYKSACFNKYFMLLLIGSSVDYFLDNFSFSTDFKLLINYFLVVSRTSYFSSSEIFPSDLADDSFLIFEECDDDIGCEHYEMFSLDSLAENDRFSFI